MIYSVQQIKFEIFQYIKEFESSFEDWYVGIASDPREQMFKIHYVDSKTDIWLYKQAISFLACKTVQKYFLENLKTDGVLVTNGGEDMDCVYLFKKSLKTSPSSNYLP